MGIITKLEKLLNTNLVLMDDNEYSELVDDLSTSNANQKKFINYILSNDTLTVDDEYKIFMLLSEAYGLEKFEESYELNLMELYEWVLKLMFKKEFYNYSICYHFSDLLVKMSKNIKQVYGDIINMIDIYCPISVQIAICSMYGFYPFTEYKELTRTFFYKILMSIEKNENNKGIIEDANKFLKKTLKQEEYKEYGEKINKYKIKNIK